MNILKYIILGFVVISIIIVLFFALRTRHFLKTLSISALIGFSTLLILHFSSSFTGFDLNITPFSITTSCTFGLPGVVAIVICKMIFGI